MIRPLPEIEPDVAVEQLAQGRAARYDNRLETARAWRELSEREKLSIRELIIKVTGRKQFVETPAEVAEAA